MSEEEPTKEDKVDLWQKASKNSGSLLESLIMYELLVLDRDVPKVDAVLNKGRTNE